MMWYNTLLTANEKRNILHEISERKANWIGHILRRNCLLQQVVERKIKGQIEVAWRRGRRRKKLLDDVKDRRWYSQLKEETLDRSMWRNRFGRSFVLVVWQITYNDDDDDDDDDDCGSKKLHVSAGSGYHHVFVIRWFLRVLYVIMWWRVWCGHLDIKAFLWV